MMVETWGQMKPDAVALGIAGNCSRQRRIHNRCNTRLDRRFWSKKIQTVFFLTNAVGDS